MTSMSGQEGALASLKEALQRLICSLCIDRSAAGTCSVIEDQECALFGYFPQIVEAVSGVQSDKMEDYVAAIREKVCVECENQDNEGLCRQRDEVRCVLDRYLLLIVEAIEEVQGVALGSRKVLVDLPGRPV